MALALSPSTRLPLWLSNTFPRGHGSRTSTSTFRFLFASFSSSPQLDLLFLFLSRRMLSSLSENAIPRMLQSRAGLNIVLTSLYSHNPIRRCDRSCNLYCTLASPFKAGMTHSNSSLVGTPILLFPGRSCGPLVFDRLHRRPTGLESLNNTHPCTQLPSKLGTVDVYALCRVWC